MLEFKEHKLQEEDDECKTILSALNPDGQRLVISASQQVSYIWELDVDEMKQNMASMRFTFSVKYKLLDGKESSEDWKLFSFEFKLSDFKVGANIFWV